MANVLDDTATDRKRSLHGAYVNRRVGVLALLGFASGLPLSLTGDTLQQWLSKSDVDIKTIGWLTLVALPYRLKFLWAPAMDRLTPPLLGRRRGWLLITQLALIAAMGLLAMSDPRSNLTWVAIAALAVAFCSASQDIVADAYRADVLPTDERGPGASLFVTGYRMAMLAGGAGVLTLVALGLPWRWAILSAAGMMLVGLLATLLAEEPPRPALVQTRQGDWIGRFRAAVLLPLVDFLQRPRGWMVLLFVLLFRLPDGMAGAMTVPFLNRLGFGEGAIALRGSIGIGVTILGALIGGGAVTAIGLRRSLWLFGFLQAGSNVGFLVLAYAGADLPVFITVVVIESFCGGLVTAGFFVFLMNQCRREFSATQYALLSSLFALPTLLTGPLSGWLIQQSGYAVFFQLTIVAAVPAMLLLPWLPTRTVDRGIPETA